MGRLATVDDDEDQFFIYSLIDGAGVFGVDSGAGTLVVAGRLDYERQSVYTVRLVSTDSGVPQLSVTQNLTVHVTDVNEPPSESLIPYKKFNCLFLVVLTSRIMGLVHDYVTCPKFTTKPGLHQIILILWHIARGYSFHFSCFGILFVVKSFYSENEAWW